jgi:hypothetical protein
MVALDIVLIVTKIFVWLKHNQQWDGHFFKNLEAFTKLAPNKDFEKTNVFFLCNSYLEFKRQDSWTAEKLSYLHQQL